jgi:chromosomal replication initiation ATPase DnaA
MKEILKYIKLYTGCDEHALKRIEAMLEPRLNIMPQVIEKIVHVEKFVKRKPRPKITILEWSEGYCKENNITYEYISQARRLQEIVDARDAYVKQAYFEGFTPSEIARHIKRNHATILHTISK